VRLGHLTARERETLARARASREGQQGADAPRLTR
jgi:hypothetical protein